MKVSFPYAVDRRQGRPQSRSGYVGEEREKN
jgi:hypothetical protein